VQLDGPQSVFASMKKLTKNGQFVFGTSEFAKSSQKSNATVPFKKCKQLFEYHHLLLLRDIWW
jgi:hypothetical protein